LLKEQNIFCTEPGPSLALVGAHQLLRQHRRFSVITERLLSEGNGEAAGIRGNRVRDLNKIQSEAYRKLRRSAAWRKATEIYARAYNQSPEAVAFYEFTRTMQAYKSIIAETRRSSFPRITSMKCWSRRNGS
jgi:regulator of protease activity HflC (stomatin/prohibitin superfamily)